MPSQGHAHCKDLASKDRVKANLPAYRQIRFIGQGAFGKAYLVESVRKDGQQQQPVPCILKKMPFKDGSAERREAAVAEALLLKRVSRGCPFVVGFREVFTAKRGAQLCLIMDYASGGDLRQVLQAREGVPVPEPDCLEWVAQICMALRHCHSLGVLHRDVKPDNCLLQGPGGRLLLADFGISTVLDERTHAETCVGTPFYLSPEVVMKQPYTQACDVWSLGVIMYEAASLRKPFRGRNVVALALQIAQEPIIPLDDVELSPQFRELLDRLMAKDQAVRATAQQALEAPCLAAAAAAACARHHVPAAAPASSGPSGTPAGGRRGLVRRLKREVMESQAAQREGDVGDMAEYPDDFEAESEDEVYAEEFEEYSEDEDYEPDFEEDLDADSDDAEVSGAPAPGPPAALAPAELAPDVEALRLRVAQRRTSGGGGGGGAAAAGGSPGGAAERHVLGFLDGLLAAQKGGGGGG